MATNLTPSADQSKGSLSRLLYDVHLPSRSAGRYIKPQRETRLNHQAMIEADVTIGAVTIHHVRATSAGVAWPERHGEPTVTVNDAETREAAERRLRRLAAEVEHKNAQEVAA